MTDPTAPARDRLFALIASIPGSGSVDWCRPARALLDEIAAVPARQAPATDGAALRDRIAAAIWERQNPGRRWADCEYRWQADAEADAEAVLAVLPVSVDRAAVLREEAALIRAHCPDHLDADSAEGSWMDCHCPVADDMERRATDETPGEPTDADVVEAHRLALSFALGLGTGAPWDAIRDRAADLCKDEQPADEAQQPKEGTRP